MMKLAVALVCGLTLMAFNASAHGAGGHGGSFHAEEVLELAPRYVASLIEKKRPVEGEILDQSWIKVANENKAIDSEGSWYYVVKMAHAVKHKTLFLLISTKGKLYGVNYKGTFEGFTDQK